MSPAAKAANATHGNQDDQTDYGTNDYFFDFMHPVVWIVLNISDTLLVLVTEPVLNAFKIYQVVGVFLNQVDSFQGREVHGLHICYKLIISVIIL